jgi:hypothetical protein
VIYKRRQEEESEEEEEKQTEMKTIEEPTEKPGGEAYVALDKAANAPGGMQYVAINQAASASPQKPKEPTPALPVSSGSGGDLYVSISATQRADPAPAPAPATGSGGDVYIAISGTRSNDKISEKPSSADEKSRRVGSPVGSPDKKDTRKPAKDIVITRQAAVKYDGSEMLIDYDDIEIGEMVGRGAFGQVYKGKWRSGAVALVRKKERKKKKRNSFPHFFDSL